MLLGVCGIDQPAPVHISEMPVTRDGHEWRLVSVESIVEVFLELPVDQYPIFAYSMIVGCNAINPVDHLHDSGSSRMKQLHNIGLACLIHTRFKGSRYLTADADYTRDLSNDDRIIQNSALKVRARVDLQSYVVLLFTHPVLKGIRLQAYGIKGRAGGALSVAELVWPDDFELRAQATLTLKIVLMSESASMPRRKLVIKIRTTRDRVKMCNVKDKFETMHYNSLTLGRITTYRAKHTRIASVANLLHDLLGHVNSIFREDEVIIYQRATDRTCVADQTIDAHFLPYLHDIIDSRAEITLMSLTAQDDDASAYGYDSDHFDAGGDM